MQKDEMVSLNKIIADFRGLIIIKTIEAMESGKDFSNANRVIAWEEDRVISALIEWAFRYVREHSGISIARNLVNPKPTTKG